MAEHNVCAIRGHCGTKSGWGKSLPCPYDGPAEEPENDAARELLVDVCGADFASGSVCCTQDQVNSLKDNFVQVEALLASCPACLNNFRSFFCSMTCSPNQSQFLNVTSTQTSYEDKIAVKSLDFFVGDDFASGFFNSCKEVKLSAANEYVMTFIGGGAKDPKAFLKFLGDEKDIGSPFQIDVRYTEPAVGSSFNPRARKCTDGDLQSRCTCIDCPDVCPVLPAVPPPGASSSCHVGRISCLSFALTNIYALVVVVVFIIFLVRLARRRDVKADRITLPGEDPADNVLSPRSHTRSLRGDSSVRHVGEDSYGSQADNYRNLGRGQSLLDPMETTQPRQYKLNTLLRRFFYRLGLLCAMYPWLTMAIVFAFFGVLNIGWKRFQVEVDPVQLWVAPDSESKIQKEYFDEHFGPFYRPQQVFIASIDPQSQSDIHGPSRTLPPPSITAVNPILSFANLKTWIGVEDQIHALRSPNGYTLQDVCFAPLGPDSACVVQSISAWFEGDIGDYEDTWKDRILQCSASPADCLPEFRQPLTPQSVLGGLPGGGMFLDPMDVLDARALVVTVVVDDSLNITRHEIGMEWEETLKKFLLKQREELLLKGLKIEFSTGVSLEQEINKSSNMDVKTVVLSYIAMFFYVALTLGNNHDPSGDPGVISSLWIWAINLPRYFRNKLSPTLSLELEDDLRPRLFPRLPRNLFVNSKFTLGLFGITLVILSVSSSVGFFSAVGIKVTLIIAEVIPFLVLAVGVDNVYILVHELDRQNVLHGPNAPAHVQTLGFAPNSALIASQGRPLSFHGQEGSIDSASVPVHFSPEERVARALSKMGPSIMLSSVTEVTAFALGAIVPMPAVRNFALYAAGSVFLNAVLQVTVFVSAMTLDLRRVESSRVDCFPCFRLPPKIALLDVTSLGASAGKIAWFIRRHYAPFLLRPVVKGIVLLSFGAILTLSVISMQHIRLGLDQRLALPSDSYLVPYFDAVDDFLEIGPPVYFVTKEVNVTERSGQRHLCGRFTTCDELSVANVLEAERNRTESSFILQPAASWIDDYLRWLDPANGCCRVRIRNPEMFCRPRDSNRLCKSCFEDHNPPWSITMDGFPEGAEFLTYLDQWLHSPADESCALGGAAAYSTALKVDDSGVSASHFRTSHPPLKSQDDYINSLRAAQRIASEISDSTGVPTFPYSLHYVFFDQYIHIIAITEEILGLGLAAVLVITSLLLGSWRTGTIVTAVVAATVTTIMGVMGLWGISLNGLSLVNLVISLGIAVEFNAHIARAFMGAGTGLPVDLLSRQKERDDRVWTALVDVGHSVLSGITFTKLIGICVLALTRSKLLQIYYFRMWLVLIISGALHGLVLLPVVLSYAGGRGYALEDADEEWMSSTIRRHEYTPFIADDESELSD